MAITRRVLTLCVCDCVYLRYPQAETMYRRALAIDPSDIGVAQNYVDFLEVCARRQCVSPPFTHTPRLACCHLQNRTDDGVYRDIEPKPMVLSRAVPFDAARHTRGTGGTHKPLDGALAMEWEELYDLVVGRK